MAFPTTTTATLARPVSVFGQPNIFRVAVAANKPNAGIPAGFVQILNRNRPVANGVVALNNNGRANFDLSGFAPGNYEFRARYLGNPNFSPSLSLASSQKINPASTVARTATSTPRITFGQTAAFTFSAATVPPGAGIPTGFVQPILNGNKTGAPLGLVNGQGSFFFPRLAAGRYTVQGRYISNSGNFSSSARSNSVTVNVRKAPTATTIGLSPAPSLFGQPIVLTAQVVSRAAGAGIPTGAIQILEGNKVIETAQLQVDGRATVTLPRLNAGRRQISIKYLGNNNFSDSSSQRVNKRVNPATTTTRIATSTPTLVAGQTALFTANVIPAPAQAGPPPGSIEIFVDRKKTGSSVALGNGRQNFSLPNLNPGTYTVQARYRSSSENFANSVLSAPVTLRVRPASRPKPRLEQFQAFA